VRASPDLIRRVLVLGHQRLLLRNLQIAANEECLQQRQQWTATAAADKCTDSQRAMRETTRAHEIAST
jgi:hypothetical protein